MREKTRAIWLGSLSLWRWAALAVSVLVAILQPDLPLAPLLTFAAYMAASTLLVPRLAPQRDALTLAILDILVLSACVFASGGERSPLYVVYLAIMIDGGVRLALQRSAMLAVLAIAGYVLAAWLAHLWGAGFDPALAVTRSFLFAAMAMSSSSLARAAALEQQRANEARLLTNLMRLAVSAGHDISALLQLTIEQACAALHADAGFIHLGAAVQGSDSASHGLRRTEMQSAFEGHTAMCARAAETGQTAAWLVHTDAQPSRIAASGRAGYVAVARVERDVACACAPLTLADESGCIYVERRRGPAFSQADVELATLVAQHAALAVHNARLHAVEQRTVAELRAAEQEKSQFLSMISHELRTPLTAIRASAGLLLEPQTGQLSGNQQRLARSIARNSDRLTSLVTDLLDMARLQSGRLSLTCVLMDLRPVIRSCVLAMRPLLDQKQQTLDVSLPSDLPRVLADRRRVEQIVTNLLSNAHRYTQGGSRLSLTMAHDGHCVSVTIADDGPGVPVDERGRIFDHFYRGAAARSGAQPGAGLGLAVAKSLVEMHGGTIGYRPATPAGSEFFFTLPLVGPQGEAL